MRFLLLIFLMLSSLQAHRLYVIADDDGKNLYIKSYFTKSSPCMECEVKIYDKNNKLLFNSKTNKDGKATFDFTSKEVNIEVFGSMGHKTKLSYESENEVITQNENESYLKILFSLALIALIFFILKKIKK